ncbi:MAG: hypothetical protein FJW79_11700 [Actinobacteria bacterium]|nr:hypothetical protein [Actinomycetota bacterium]
MTRARQPADWETDLERGRQDEDEFRRALQDHGFGLFRDGTGAFQELDFCVDYRDQPRWIDVKGKWSHCSGGISALWPEVPSTELMVVDETVFRRVVSLGGAGYLAIHDHPGDRWVYLGPWELTLSENRRFQRREHRSTSFLEGKILLDLRCSSWVSEGGIDIPTLLDLFEAVDSALDIVDAIEFPNEPPLPVLGH